MRREQTVIVRLSQIERRALTALAQQQERTLSEMVRELVRNEAERQGVWQIVMDELQVQEKEVEGEL